MNCAASGYLLPAARAFSACGWSRASFGPTSGWIWGRAVVLSRDPQAFRQKQPHLADVAALSFQQGDVRNFAFPPGTFSHVIHAATEASARLNEQSPAIMLDTIVAGTERTLDFAVACGAKKLLLISSGAVYGRQPPEMTHVGEDYNGSPDSLAPSSAYGEGKRMAELLCAIYGRQHGIDARIARCYALVGPYLPLDIHFALGNFLRDALYGDPIRVLGDGRVYRSYLYAADLAIWLWTILFKGVAMPALQCGKRPGDINFGGGASCRSIARLIFQRCMSPNRRIHRRRPRATCLRSSGLSGNLGWKCSFRFRSPCGVLLHGIEKEQSVWQIDRREIVKMLRVADYIAETVAQLASTTFFSSPAAGPCI